MTDMAYAIIGQTSKRSKNITYKEKHGYRKDPTHQQA